MKFLTLLTALILAASADSKADDSHAPARTGNGAWTYETVPGWGLKANGSTFGPTHGGIAVDPQSGNVFVTTDSERGILVYKPCGEAVGEIAPQCQDFHDIKVRVEEGKTVFYGAQLGGPNPLRICKIDTEGNELMEISEATVGEIPGGWRGLTAVAVAPDGSIFIGMGYGSNLIHKFSAGGELILSFGGRGDGDDKFRTCHGLAIDERFEEPRLLVVDRENRRLVHYTLDGELIGTHATHLRRPCTVTIHGDVVAVAELEGRVTILDTSGTLIAFLGDNPDNSQWANFRVALADIPGGIFTAPHGITFDKEGNLYVQDWNASGRVTKLRLVSL